MTTPITLDLGAWTSIDGKQRGLMLRVPANDLVTHGVVVGMTGSGKTGLVTVLIEEALCAGIPVLAIDVKGDLPNLLLSFPSLDVAHLAPWVEQDESQDAKGALEHAQAVADQRRRELETWSIGDPEIERFHRSTSLRVITPGATAGELLHVLSPLERRSDRWNTDPDSARDALSAAVSLLLRLLGRDPDPAKSREHVLLSVLAERRLRGGENADLGSLLRDLADPPIETVGEMPLNSFLRSTERRKLAAAINALLASPTFASWRQGATLDIGEWMAPKDGRTPGVVVSVAHLDDEERALVLGVILEEVLSWVRTLPGSQKLRALLVFDEVYGFLPPHPANPPTKRPLVSLMKQARAFGVGVVVATQNPMDLDYRALSNAGLWFVGRLQTDADRARVADGLALATRADDEGVRDLERTLLQCLAPRWFVVRDVHAASGPLLLHPRWTMSFMRGPMTRGEIRRARRWREGDGGERCGGNAAPVVGGSEILRASRQV
jgi:hypothetical protein